MVFQGVDNRIIPLGFRRVLGEAHEKTKTLSGEKNFPPVKKVINIDKELLCAKTGVIKRVLDRVTDLDRLILYQLEEVSGRNRKKLLSYFKERGL
jgi:hypothetical protein